MLDVKNVLLFEPGSADFPGHALDQGLMYMKYLISERKGVLFSCGEYSKKFDEMTKVNKVKMYHVYDKISSVSRNKILKTLLYIFLGIKNYLKLFKIAEKENVDVIHNLTFRLIDSVPLLIACFLTRKSTSFILNVHSVYFRHSYNPKAIVSNLSTAFLMSVLKYLVKLNVISKIIVYTNALNDVLKYFLGNGIVEKVNYPVLIDTKKFRYSENASRKILKIQSEFPLALLFSRKKTDSVIKNMFFALNETSIPFNLLFAGKMEGSFVKEMKDLIKKTGWRGNVIIENGYVDSIKKFHYINASDFVILPYDKNYYNETKCISAFISEVVVAGKPILMTKVGENSDFVEEKYAGIIINDTVADWGSGIDNVLKNLVSLKTHAYVMSKNLNKDFYYRNVLKNVYRL